MKEKSHLLMIGALLLLIVSAVYFSLRESSQEMPTPTESDVAKDPLLQKADSTLQTLESGVELGTDGIVTALDLSGVAFDAPALITIKTDSDSLYAIAIPTMGLPLCAAQEKIADVYEISPGDKVSVRGITDEAGQIVPCTSETHQFIVSGVYLNTDTGLAFEYRKGPGGYSMKETKGQQFSTGTTFVTDIMLTNKADAEELLLSDFPRELPPSISLRVYKNSEKLLPVEWTRTKSVESNYDFAVTEPVEISVGGKKAVGYTIDGLYAADTYVVAFGDYILIITGQYIDSESEIYRDLEKLVDTVSFTR